MWAVSITELDGSINVIVGASTLTTAVAVYCEGRHCLQLATVLTTVFWLLYSVIVLSLLATTVLIGFSLIAIILFSGCYSTVPGFYSTVSGC